MPEPTDPLWHRLRDYRIGPPDAEFTFVQRLARENRWPESTAEEVLQEYLRFCYLAVTADHEVTPSDQVDQAWHLHLTYSRDYWQRFCPDVLGCDLHHGPTAGGSAERQRYYHQYAETLKSYEEAFGQAPPGTIWSPARERFGQQPLGFRVRPSDVIVLKDWPGKAQAAFAACVLLAIGFAVGAMFGELWGG